MAKKKHDQAGMMTPEAAAQYLGLSVRTLRRYADDPDKPITAHKYSRTAVRFDRDELERFKEQCRVVKL